MSTQATQVLSEVEKLLQQDKYREALDQLALIDREALSREEYGYLCILLSEASLYIGDYSETCVDDAIEIFRFHSDTEKFARAKFLKGWLLSVLGRYREAREILLEAYVNHLRCNDLTDAARALNRLSFVSLQLGNVESSIDNLDKCIQLYRQLNDSSSETLISNNLGYLFFTTGKFCKSITTYSQIASDILKEGEKNTLIYYEMSAIPHALKGDIATAKKTIAKATPYLEKYPREKAIYYENLGLISILDGDYAGAERALKSGLEISLEIAPESALVSQIKRLFGDLYVATKKYDLAEKYATEALEVAEKINERVEIAACYRIFAQVEQHRGTPITSSGAPSVVNRPHPCPSPSVRRGEPAGGVRILCRKRGYRTDKAREWYKKSIDLFSLIGSRYELAVTRFLAVTSGLYSNGERRAMLYLAREYFESEEVHPYVDKIDAALKAVPNVPRPIRKPSPACPTIIAVNPQMKKLIALAEHVAESEMTVLLTGETGTGKDLLARYIHYYSGRRGEFVAVNAAAVPDTMIEAELFGYKKGAFTGSTDRTGLLEQAHNGTFYLNEITDATPVFQAKLLEVLESREIRRLGENTTRKVNFRLIAASNHDLHQRMRDNLFRLDLYHRLNEICIHLPSLDERKDDIPALVRHFLTFAGFNLTDGNESEVERLGKILSHRTWPGNVRELEHEVKRLWTGAKGDLSRMIELALDSSSKSKPEFLLQLLEMHNWNRREVARELGVSEGTIRAWIKKLGLQSRD
jgi:transcriptional regulator with AAA-type ATPase domain/tetratricopeptide (TPR) repeat protein